MRNEWAVRGESGRALTGAERAAVPSVLTWLDRCAALYAMAPTHLGLEVGDGAGCWTRGGQVHVGRRVLVAAGRGVPAARAMLAHEAAHLAQGRVAGVADAVVDCEREAGLAAVWAMAGRPFACRRAAGAERALGWGRVGHYYTVYYMALACGATAEEAARMALYTQIPDLVAELDAVECAKDYYFQDSRQKLIMSHVRAGTTSLISDVVRSAGLALEVGAFASVPIAGGGLSETINRGTQAVARPVDELHSGYIWDLVEADAAMQQDMAVQRGLHALTGRSVRKERAFRRGILDQLPWGSREFGLALHAFGDSYAHTQLGDSDKMYETGIGHMLDLHAPDVVSKHAETYRVYCHDLYDLFSGKSPRKKFDQATAMDYVEAVLAKGQAAEAAANAYNLKLAVGSTLLGPLGAIPQYTLNEDGEKNEEAQQIALIKSWTGVGTFNAPIDYDPPDEAVKWIDFLFDTHPRPKVWPQAGEFAWMLAMAMKWAGDAP